MKVSLIALLLIFSQPLSAEVITITNGVEKTFITNIGDTITIGDYMPLTTRGVAGAMLLTGIAANNQSKPIPLKQGTDVMCGTDLEKYLPKNSCF